MLKRWTKCCSREEHNCTEDLTLKLNWTKIQLNSDQINEKVGKELLERGKLN